MGDTDVFIIWFRVDESDPGYVKLEVTPLERAQQAWDKLVAGGFVMVSARP